MNRKHVIAACVTSVSIIGVFAALGFGQPDGIDPPPGPVADTQPSLTSIDLKLDGLAANAGRFPSDLKFFQDNIGGNQTNETIVFVPASEADFVRIYGVIVTSANTNLLVGDSETLVANIGGSAVVSSGDLRGSSNVDFGGLRVPTPVKFRTGGSDSASRVTLLYWIEE